MHAMIARRTTGISLVALTLALSGCGPTLATRFQSHIDYLASDQLTGRGVGTEGIEQAAAYIAERFAAIGIEPMGDHGSYFQTYDMTLHRELTDEARFTFGASTTPPVLHTDFVPMGFSSNDDFDGEVVFCGYGIEREEKGHDDFVHLDVEGKVALILRGEPVSWSDEDGFPTRHASLRNKIYNAKDRGAVAVLIVNQPPEEGETDKLDPFRGSGSDDFGLPVFQVSRKAAEEQLAAAKMDSLAALQENLDASSRGSGTLRGVRASGRAGFKIRTAPTSNVVGIWRGEGPLAGEYVVVGAHYDHLGIRVPMMRRFKGGKSVLETQEPQIHNGADDNASGTSAVIEIARLFAHAERPKRSIIFITFTAEESGLLGSKYFMEHPPVAADRIVAMLNMDMVGRMKPGTKEIQVFDVDSGEGLGEILAAAARTADLVTQEASEGGARRSDHGSFISHRIPSLHFYTGGHLDYHKPSDDSEKINAEGGAKVVRLVYETAVGVANRDQRLAFIESKAGPTNVTMTSFRVVMGLTPNYANDGGGGMLVDAVSVEGPAEVAGMKARDRIMSIGGKEIANVYDYMASTRNNKPGDEVEVIVQRGDKEVTLRVTLAGAG